MTPRVVVVGDAMLDVVVRPSASVAPTSDTPSRVRVGRGGAAANLAVANNVPVHYLNLAATAPVPPTKVVKPFKPRRKNV